MYQFSPTFQWTLRQVPMQTNTWEDVVPHTLGLNKEESKAQVGGLNF